MFEEAAEEGVVEDLSCRCVAEFVHELAIGKICVCESHECGVFDCIEHANDFSKHFVDVVLG